MPNDTAPAGSAAPKAEPVALADEFARLAIGATPGPWETGTEADVLETTVLGICECHSYHRPSGCPMPTPGDGPNCEGCADYAPDDAAFIAFCGTNRAAIAAALRHQADCPALAALRSPSDDVAEKAALNYDAGSDFAHLTRPAFADGWRAALVAAVLAAIENADD
jgi:hypothetical protein